jgi:hypothetical protein
MNTLYSLPENISRYIIKYTMKPTLQNIKKKNHIIYKNIEKLNIALLCKTFNILLEKQNVLYQKYEYY